MTWEPVLSGVARERALAAVADIVASLEDPRGPYGACEWAERAVLFGQLERAFPGAGHAEAAARALDESASFVGERHYRETLYAGYVGVGWAWAHLTEALDIDHSAIDDVDEALLHRLGPGGWQAHWDLIHGLGGIGVYALERWPHGASREILRRVVEHLAALAVPAGDGLALFTTTELMPPAHRQEQPDGYFDLGAAHGAPGVLPVLTAALRLDVAAADARRLLEGLTRFVLAQRQPATSPSLLPCWMYRGRPGDTTRVSWCYGDLGAGLPLYEAGLVLGDDSVQRGAIELLAHAAGRGRDAGVVDGGLCHGAIGAAHLFQRAWLATGDERMAAAAERWYVRGLEMRGPDGWRTASGGSWVADSSFLTGAQGIALGLLAACFEHEPGWDRRLAVSSLVRA